MNPLIRFGIAALFLIIGGLAFFLGSYRLGVTGAAIGMILLIFAFPNEAERKGYQDF
ncbi:MAG: hypothetical protein ACFCD0_16190 [Gemmataceae bacterium]